MILLLLLSGLCILCFTVWYKLSVRRKKIYYVRPSEISGKWYFIYRVISSIGDSVESWEIIKFLSLESLQKGGVVRFPNGTQTAYAITDPDDCATIANQCLEKDFLYELFRPWLGNGMLTADVPTWKRHRKMLSLAFNQNILNSYISVFNDKARIMVKQLAVEEGKGLFDHGHHLALCNLDIICKTALGIDTKEHEAMVEVYLKSLEKMLKIIVERFKKRWLQNPLIFNLSDLKKEHDKELVILRRLTNMMLEKRKCYLANKNTTDVESDEIKPFMDLILEMSSDKGIYTDDEIRDEVDTIIFGGHDTAAITLTFALVLLGSYADVQHKLFEELHNVFGDSKRDVTKHDLSKLVYTEAVLKETLRLYPVGPVVARLTTEDVKLKNYTIPAGSSCYLLLWGLHHHDVWGADADEFKPERWFLSSTILENSNAFGGFSIGPRACRGRVFAMMSMKTILVHLLRQYRVKADITKMKLKFESFLKPASGHLISIEKRP